MNLIELTKENIHKYKKSLMFFFHENKKYRKHFDTDIYNTTALELMSSLSLYTKHYLLVSESSIIAFISIELSNNMVYIGDIVVNHDKRGNGVFNIILKKIYKIHKCKYFSLNVSTNNIDAIISYLKNGFLVQGFLRGYYFEDVDGLYMVKNNEKD